MNKLSDKGIVLGSTRNVWNSILSFYPQNIHFAKNIKIMRIFFLYGGLFSAKSNPKVIQIIQK